MTPETIGKLPAKEYINEDLINCLEIIFGKVFCIIPIEDVKFMDKCNNILKSIFICFLQKALTIRVLRIYLNFNDSYLLINNVVRYKMLLNSSICKNLLKNRTSMIFIRLRGQTWQCEYGPGR